eukprot:2114579-Rhodomonas_salina.1
MITILRVCWAFRGWAFARLGCAFFRPYFNPDKRGRREDTFVSLAVRARVKQRRLKTVASWCEPNLSGDSGSGHIRA